MRNIKLRYKLFSLAIVIIMAFCCIDFIFLYYPHFNGIVEQRTEQKLVELVEMPLGIISDYHNMVDQVA